MRMPSPARRRLAAALVSAPLALVLPLPALAAPVEDRPVGSSDRSAPVIEVGDPSSTLTTDSRTTPVAPGLTLTEFDRFDARGWVRGDVLTAQLGDGGVTPDLLFPGSVAAAEPLSTTAGRADAVAGVNGDFFDINGTKAPLGAMIDGGELVAAPTRGWREHVGLGADGVARLAELTLEGTVTLPAGELPLAGFNTHRLPAGAVGAFTPVWGTASRAAVAPSGTPVTEVTVVAGRVTAVRVGAGAGAVAEGATVLHGNGTAAAALAALQPGDAVELAYRPRTDAGTDLLFAVGGNLELLRDGTPAPDLDDRVSEPRSAVGISENGRTMWLVTVDGRQRDSRGMTYRELADLLRGLGADDGLNLDGGGSSTLVARDAGAGGATVQNSPSDGTERLTPNGIGLFAAAGSGELTGFRLDAAGDQAPARVFPGLSRTLTAFGHDETYAPVQATPSWSAQPAAIARIESPGVVRGVRPGDAEVTAAGGTTRSAVPLHVLGPLVRLDTDTAQVSLPGPQATGTFTVRGYDADGFAAVVEPRDVVVEHDPATVRIEPDGDAFRVVPLVDSGAALVTVRVGDRVHRLAVTIGLRTVPLADFESTAGWNAVRFPSALPLATLTSVPGRTGNGLRADYRMTDLKVTRAHYVSASPQVPLPAGTQKIGLWVHGDGQGAWLRANITDGRTTPTVSFPNVTWTGWRYVETDVPATLTGALRLTRAYVVETVRNRVYDGTIILDDLVAKVAQTVDVPAAAQTRDPVVVQDGVLEGERWRFAVVSDAQFTADAPDSDIVRQARRTLREVVAAAPDFVVINGDFVDRAFARDLDLARKVIDDELQGRLPWYYVPGNHEITGPGTIEEFRAEFGATRRTFDHKGTRFLLLDSSSGTFRTDFAQLQELRRGLDGARGDSSVRSVVVMAHHPTRDPSPVKNSQLSDRKEAALLERWLADFRRDTGKGAGYLAAHVGAFSAEHVDGVSYVVNGNMGKGPSAAPENGGFTGWSMVGIDPRVPAAPLDTRHRAAAGSRVAAAQWLRIEMRPHVDTVELSAPTELTAGTGAPVRATAVQPFGRRVPVAYPVAHDWTAGPTVHLGPVEQAGTRHVLAFDPATGVLTALRPGSGVLRVTVNGVSEQAAIAVVGAAVAPAA